jgi:hypothetical protein
MGANRFSTAIRVGKNSGHVSEEGDDDKLYNSHIHLSCLINKKAGDIFSPGREVSSHYLI